MPTNFRGDDGHELTLPDYLFYPSDEKSKNISPAAVLDPAAALDGDGWKSATAPSCVPAKKTLIINKDTFVSPPNLAEAIAFIARLKSAGFQIVFKLDNVLEPFVELDDDLNNIEEYLCSLAPFYKKEDPKKLAQINVPYDRSVVVRRSQRSEIDNYFNDIICYEHKNEKMLLQERFYYQKQFVYKFRYIPEEELKKIRDSTKCRMPELDEFIAHYYSASSFKREETYEERDETYEERRDYGYRIGQKDLLEPNDKWDEIYTEQVLSQIVEKPQKLQSIINARVEEIGHKRIDEMSFHDLGSMYKAKEAYEELIKRFRSSPEILAELPDITIHAFFLEKICSSETLSFIFHKRHEDIIASFYDFRDWLSVVDFEDGKEFIDRYLLSKAARDIR